MLFKDRLHAGQLVAELLGSYRESSVIILGLARGGIVTATAVGKQLETSVDVLVVKKIGSPANAEYAIGAVAPDNVSVIHWKDAQREGMDEADIQRETGAVSRLVDGRMRTYRRGKRPLNVQGKTVVLVDDGAATGATMEAAVLWARKKGARHIAVALPVASVEAGNKLRPEVDAYIVYREEARLGSVGAYYESFPQVTDEEVVSHVRP